MVINKLFGKKDPKAGIDSLKERFSQVSQNPADPNQPPAQQSAPAPQPTTQEVSPEPTVQVQDAISQPPAQQPTTDAFGNPLVQNAPAQTVAPAPQPTPSAPAQQPFGQQPLGMATAPPLQQTPQQVPAQPVAPAQPPSQDVAPAIPQTIPAPTPAPSSQQTPATDLPSWAVESAGEEIAQELGGTSVSAPAEQNKAQQTLEQIEDKYYDAKLNSLIIDQVKELIEIDNNLSTRIDDGASEIKKEITEREKLAKKVDEHFEKVKELEANMEKFLGLYEMVTNQFNPFVDKGSSEMFLADEDKKYPNPVVADPEHPNDPVTPPPTPQAEDPIPPELRAPVNASQPAPPQQVPQQPMPSQAQHQATPTAGDWTYCPIHHNIHPSLHFELSNGQKLSSIYDVLAVLEQMDDETFMAHVNLKQNDLSQWIYKVLGLTDLGQQLDLIKTKPEMIQSIRSYIQDKMKKANQ